ncbi:TetR family transcriptional regulator [Frankia sp. CiP3]|uniref:TetR family transcriptional regulator n=1 Tax=Frankia sp. CiP3 TaxID=2880971 RepID=UPI001EF65DE8|nr:TetR family transcriptional regulator [Frankia sp. CiP3]
MTNPTGITAFRERLRTTVRGDLAQVAVELFLEHGFDAVTVDAIATAAGVSRSTFFRYFQTKEDAVLAHVEARGEQFRQAALARPAGEPALLAARNALTPLIEDMSRNRERSVAINGLIERTPSLRARRIDKQLVLRTMLADAMANRMATDPATDLRPALIAGVTLSVFEAAHTAWLSADDDTDLADLVDEAFVTVGAAFATAAVQP